MSLLPRRSVKINTAAATENRLDPRRQLRRIRDTQARFPVVKALSARALKAAMEEGRA